MAVHVHIRIQLDFFAFRFIAEHLSSLGRAETFLASKEESIVLKEITSTRDRPLHNIRLTSASSVRH